MEGRDQYAACQPFNSTKKCKDTKQLSSDRNQACGALSVDSPESLLIRPYVRGTCFGVGGLFSEGTSLGVVLCTDAG